MPPTPRKLLKRIENPLDCRYLTFSCRHRLPLFNNDRIKETFQIQLDKVHRTGSFELFAWVIMPEHVHLLLRPKLPDHTVATITASIKRPFAERIIRSWRELNAAVLTRLREEDGAIRFGQPGGGYDRNIFSQDEFSEKIGYIHRNPVVRNLVEQAIDWPWSSARWYAGMHENSIPVDQMRT